MPTEDDREAYMGRAFELAREAGERGDGPYGSVLVLDGDILMEESNREVTDDDIAAHPELALARRGARELTPEECENTVMYTSTEPCPMCAGGIAIAGLGGVVYSVGAARAAEAFGDSSLIPCGEVFERFGHDVEVVRDVRADEGLDIHREYRTV
jgi:tRNA(Arg) A34 adenosine deaminase TadA